MIISEVINYCSKLQACFTISMLALFLGNVHAQTDGAFYTTFDPHLSTGLPYADRGDIIFEAGSYLIVGSGYVDAQNKRVTNLLKINPADFKVVDSAEIIGPQGDQNFLAGIDGHDGYLYFTGEWADYTTQRMRMFLAKYTIDFDLVWINYFPELHHPDFSFYAYDLCRAHDGGLMMVYNRQDFVSDPRALLDTRMIKTDTAGNVVFNKQLPDSLWLSMGRGNISTANDSHYIVTTYSEQESTLYQEDFILHKIDEAGNVVWTRVENGSTFGWQPPKSIMLDNGGSAVAWIKDTLVIFENNEWFTRFFQLHAYDEAGQSSWHHTWWTKMNSPILDLHKSGNGDILGCGLYDDFNGWRKSWLFRFSPDGVLKWQRIYNDSINRPFVSTHTPLFFWKMTELSDGRLAITGYAIDSSSYPGSNGMNANVLLMVLDSAGCLQPDCTGENQLISSIADWPILHAYTLSPLTLNPNPVSAIVNIEWAIEPTFNRYDLILQAYDGQGKLIWSDQWNGYPMTLDVSLWPEGFITLIALNKHQPVASGKLLKVSD